MADGAPRGAPSAGHPCGAPCARGPRAVCAVRARFAPAVVRAARRRYSAGMTTTSETPDTRVSDAAPSLDATTTTYVYSFGEGRAEGTGQMREVLGGKGAGLAEMTNAGVPVPPGFTITTDVCRWYTAHAQQLPPGFDAQQRDALER